MNYQNKFKAGTRVVREYKGVITPGIVENSYKCKMVRSLHHSSKGLNTIHWNINSQIKLDIQYYRDIRLKKILGT